VWIGAARKGPAANAQKRKEQKSQKTDEAAAFSANDEVEDGEGDKENNSANANKVSATDEIQARAGGKQTSKAVRRGSFDVVALRSLTAWTPSQTCAEKAGSQ
jgi:hypothetical protein